MYILVHECVCVNSYTKQLLCHSKREEKIPTSWTLNQTSNWAEELDSLHKVSKSTAKYLLD